MQAVDAASAWELLTSCRALTTASLWLPPLLVGSGKFGTPWERMQRAYASAPFCVAVVVVAAVVEELPPQPAVSSETAAIATMEVGKSVREDMEGSVSFQSRAEKPGWVGGTAAASVRHGALQAGYRVIWL
jgi:hypothetical protein